MTPAFCGLQHSAEPHRAVVHVPQALRGRLTDITARAAGGRLADAAWMAQQLDTEVTGEYGPEHLHMAAGRGGPVRGSPRLRRGAADGPVRPGIQHRWDWSSRDASTRLWADAGTEAWEVAALLVRHRRADEAIDGMPSIADLRAARWG